MDDHSHRSRGKDLRKGRISVGGHIYLLTTVTSKRSPIFSDYALGRCVVRALNHASITSRAVSLAFVVMPDHMHWLIQLSNNGTLSALMRSFKAGSAKCVNEQRGQTGVRLWQSGFHDHALRREEDLRRVAKYIVANPLRAGLVKRIGDYPLWDAIWM